jgi:hypothetical protein
MENQAQAQASVGIEQLARQPIKQESLNPGSGKFIEYTSPEKMIEDNRQALEKIVANLRKQRSEEGFTGFNKPVVFLACVQQDARAKGKRQGWYVDIIQFHLKGCQMQPVAVERAIKLGHVVIDFDLPSRDEAIRIVKENEAMSESETMRVFTAEDLNRFTDLVKFCTEAKSGIKKYWAAKDNNLELKKKAEQAEARAKAAEEELSKLKKKGA